MISRYSVKKINDIFSDKRKYENWLKIEFLLLKYLAGIGYLREKEVERAEKDAIVFLDQIKEEERRVKHDVVAFLNCISRTAVEEVQKWIHYGLTSSDLVDTGNSMALKEANDLILDYAQRVLRRLKYMAHKHRETFYLKRKGGKIVGVSTFGYMLSGYYSSVREFMEAFMDLRPSVECVSMSGSVGTCSYLGAEVQDFVANELGLFSVPISTQVVSRERYYTYFSLLSFLGQIMNSLSLELRMLATTEIGEIEESFSRNQVGSSSMPHKRNPVTLENICGLSRLLDGYANASSKNSLIWFERDISHSSADRVLFVDGITIAIQIMRRMGEVLEMLRVNEKRMAENVEKHSFMLQKPRLANYLFGKKLFTSEAEAAFKLEEINNNAQRYNIDFKEAFSKASFARKLTSKEIESLFDMSKWFKHQDILYRRIYGDFSERSDFAEIFYEEEEINYAIDVLAEKLNYEFRNCVEPVSVISMRGPCSIFVSRILLKFKFPVELRTLEKNPKDVDKKEKVDLDRDLLRNRNVLILEEIMEDSKTLRDIGDMVMKFKPRILKTCVLFYVNREEVRKQVDYAGLPLETNKNVAGFGIVDFLGRYRNLNFIGRVKGGEYLED